MTTDQLLDQRETTHGSFLDNSVAFSRLVDALPVSSFDPVVQYAVAGLYMKLARINSGQAMRREHWEDVAGYAEQVCRLIDEANP